MHVIATPMLLAMARTADHLHLNRRLVTERIEKEVDPNGIHVIGTTFLHNESEMRCEVLMKMRGKEDPAVAWVDVPLDLPEGKARLKGDVDWSMVTKHSQSLQSLLDSAPLDSELNPKDDK